MTTTTDIPGHWTVREARDHYLAVNGFSMDGYSATTFTLPAFGRTITVPNPPARRKVVAFHDLHHIVSGYGTDYAGEGEVGAFELRAGCTGLFLYAINLVAASFALLLAPRRVLRAWWRAGRARSLYLGDLTYEQALELRVDELRRRLGVPEAGYTAPA
jgi:hypothetical protein